MHLFLAPLMSIQLFLKKKYASLSQKEIETKKLYFFYIPGRFIERKKSPFKKKVMFAISF